MLTASGATHPGRVRQMNEDVFLCDTDLGLFIVADGMGGHHAGEVASQLAVESIRGFLARTSDGSSVTWPYGIDPKLSFDGNRLVTAVKLANRRVFKAGESREDYTGMGTTVVAGLVSGDRFVFAGVGDSRIYSLARDAMIQLTTDDTWVALMMTGQGDLDARVLANHPMKHVLTNVVGARDQIDVVVQERALDVAETFLFSSDGLHGSLDDAAIERLLRSGQPPESLADLLVQEALTRGGEDNITAVVVRFTP
jgi:PPM family protein phosphatase